jgi:small ligand-binding sensory domain FIST
VTSDPAAIEADIERQREQLAGTVDALTAKLDVKARAESKAADVLDAVTTDSGRPRPQLVGVVAAALAGTALLIWWRSRR